MSLMEATVDPPSRGSRLDADHPLNGVLIPCRFTTRLDFADRTFDAAVATFLFCVLPEELQVPGLRELGRVVKTGGPVRLLEYVRPHRTVRRVLTRLWEPWIAWAYGARFDRRTEEHTPEAGLEFVEARFVIDDLVRLISARASS
jgi:SAM-dependent methyltransferase